MECTLYLAEGCNMHCRYCYEGKQKKNGLMDKGTVEHVLEYLVENALENEKIHLILLGGEPLLNKTAFFHIINIIRNQYGNIRKKFLIEMTTNGTLLDGDVIKAVKDEKIELSVSIDGKKETQNMNRMSIDEKDEFPIIMEVSGRDGVQHVVGRVALIEAVRRLLIEDVVDLPHAALHPQF